MDYNIILKSKFQPDNKHMQQNIYSASVVPIREPTQENEDPAAALNESP